jgi:hypothetical protein
MKILLLLIALSAALPAQEADRLSQLHEGYISRHDAISAEHDKALESLKTGYLGALTRLKDRLQRTGSLETVTPVVDEYAIVREHTWPLPDLNPTAPRELKSLRETYAKSIQSLETKRARELVGIADKMTAALKAQETELTKAGNLESAQLAKHMRESLEKDEKLRDARDFLQFGGTSGQSRPAMQIRRSGDNLEVLVLFDRSGKITMDSPVTNVRERTTPGRELGDTSATTLGEFVGAKGYKVHPYVAFHQVFEGNEALGMSFTEIIPDHKIKIEGETGMALSFQPAAKNPHISLGPILPSAKQGGSARIRVRYFIPKENRALQRFQFVQYVGGPLGGKRFETQGKWIEESIEFDAAHEMPGLLFYLSCVEGKTIPDAAGESILLGALRIEHTSFPAFLQKSIDSTGRPIDEVTDPAKQPQIIRNGVLLER